MTDQPKNTAFILMADDDEDDCLLVAEAFKRSRLAVELRSVRDGGKLMEYLHNHQNGATVPRPDLILLDLNMPRRDGREALREIKADAGLRSIPVVILTTSSSQRDIELCYGLGANAYVIKPMSFEKLTELIGCLSRFWFHCAVLPENNSRA